MSYLANILKISISVNATPKFPNIYIPSGIVIACQFFRIRYLGIMTTKAIAANSGVQLLKIGISIKRSTAITISNPAYRDDKNRLLLNKLSDMPSIFNMM
jgi:hypothetical protein